MSPTAQTLLLALFVGNKLAYGIPTAPAPSSSPEYSISQVAQFDNIAGLPAVGAAPVGSNSIYQNLKFPGFSLVETMAPATGQLPLLIPQSAPNLIGFSTTNPQTILGGKSFLYLPSPQLLPALLRTAEITVNYSDSSIDYFNLASFYYGCTTELETSLLGIPVSCTITVTGYGAPSAGSPKLAEQTFSFTANGLNQDMVKGVFSSAFAKLYSVEFTLNAAVNAVTLGLVDNVATTIFSKSPVTVN